MADLENLNTKISNLLKKSLLSLSLLLGLGSGSLMCQSLTVEQLSKAHGEPSCIADYTFSSLTGDSPITFNIPQLPFETKSTEEPHSVMVASTNYLDIYHKTLGVFCKAENKLSANAPVNLRMRLGSLEYVDGLEGK